MRTFAALLVVLTLAACGSDPACTAENATGTSSVDLRANQFQPSCIKISAGNTMTFRNQDAVAHTVTTDANQLDSFDSGALAPGAQYQHAFTVAGTVKLHCSIHSGMNATVVVVP